MYIVARVIDQNSRVGGIPAGIYYLFVMDKLAPEAVWTIKFLVVLFA